MEEARETNKAARRLSVKETLEIAARRLAMDEIMEMGETTGRLAVEKVVEADNWIRTTGKWPLGPPRRLLQRTTQGDIL